MLKRIIIIVVAIVVVLVVLSLWGVIEFLDFIFDAFRDDAAVPVTDPAVVEPPLGDDSGVVIEPPEGIDEDAVIVPTE